MVIKTKDLCDQTILHSSDFHTPFSFPFKVSSNQDMYVSGADPYMHKMDSEQKSMVAKMEREMVALEVHEQEDLILLIL
jgi:hypothetical protein